MIYNDVSMIFCLSMTGFVFFSCFASDIEALKVSPWGSTWFVWWFGVGYASNTLVIRGCEKHCAVTHTGRAQPYHPGKLEAHGDASTSIMSISTCN